MSEIPLKQAFSKRPLRSAAEPSLLLGGGRPPLDPSHLRRGRVRPAFLLG